MRCVEWYSSTVDRLLTSYSNNLEIGLVSYFEPAMLAHFHDYCFSLDYSYSNSSMLLIATDLMKLNYLTLEGLFMMRSMLLRVIGCSFSKRCSR